MNSPAVYSLLGIYQKADPNLYQLLKLLVDDVYNLNAGLPLPFPKLSLDARNRLRPVIGNVIFNTTFNCIEFYDGTNWIDIGFEKFVLPIQGSAAGGTETTLMSVILPSNFFNRNGRFLIVDAFGQMANNGNNKRTRLEIAGNVISNSTLAVLTNLDWHHRVVITRDKTNNFQSGAEWFAADTTTHAMSVQKSQNRSLGFDPSKEIEIRVTGDGTALNDVTGDFMVIK